jgi:glycosyltransferase involved in cell wall biosynthesis
MSTQQQHVLFVVNSYPPRLGGLENHVASLAAQLVADGHLASVVTLSGRTDAPSMERGVSVTRLLGRFSIGSVISIPGPGTARRITRSMRGTGITAVSTHTRFFPMSAVGRTVARRLGVPLVHTEHGSAHVRGVSWLIGIGSRIVDVTMGRAILRRADAVLAVSEQVSAFVQRLAGVDSVLFYNAIEAPTVAEPAPLEPHRFVFVGRIVPGKGWDDLLTASALLITREPERHFTVDILGSGPSMPDLTRLVARRGLRDIVTVYGQVSPDIVHARLRGAVMVNPTRLAEGFQTTLLEALAAGSQVVTYPVPGAERLQADGAPVRIAGSQTVEELSALMSQSLRDPLAAFSPEQLARWTWPERARQYASILATLRRR